MKLNLQKIATLLVIFTITIPRHILAQDLPAETYQPGYWQPVDRFDVKRSVEVLLINKTEIPLEYDITDLKSTNPQALKAGERGTLKNFGNSVYIVVYPTISIDYDNLLTLRFNVKVEKDNTIIVTIKNAPISTKTPNFLGHRAINLQENGGIYLY
ncbi:hypothetical protein [cyanobacterium endosymbiont of Epithemia turgida]|uniref:hypothetical protein n=1 Tax=cyanobacterium endosymbiont of Epithemia turgida TaxID=718217 RepID=UPI0004D0FB73|nr:hypothetical protein [cyanobacterium endosymbiont of Epithemia turgida]BAP17221.1 hypothetical protein ETSB_0354 [cyanobacterium endosymbiont of Epithemia turgida isolate EtSB Lake Yunoko]